MLDVLIEVKKLDNVIKTIQFSSDNENAVDIFWLISYRYRNHDCLLECFINGKHCYRFYGDILYVLDNNVNLEA